MRPMTTNIGGEMEAAEMARIDEEIRQANEARRQPDSYERLSWTFSEDR